MLRYALALGDAWRRVRLAGCGRARLVLVDRVDGLHHKMVSARTAHHDSTVPPAFQRRRIVDVGVTGEYLPLVRGHVDVGRRRRALIRIPQHGAGSGQTGRAA